MWEATHYNMKTKEHCVLVCRYYSEFRSTGLSCGDYESPVKYKDGRIEVLNYNDIGVRA